MTKTVTINNLTAVNEAAWYKEASERLSTLPVKVRWNLKKNMNLMIKMDQDFQEFKASEEKPIFDKYGDDEHSYVEGTQRKVKEEFLEEYQKDVAKINEKLYEILNTTQEVELFVIDMDEMIETLPDDAPLTDADFDMLSLFDVEKVEAEVVE